MLYQSQRFHSAPVFSLDFVFVALAVEEKSRVITPVAVEMHFCSFYFFTNTHKHRKMSVQLFKDTQKFSSTFHSNLK